jgi:hypothetical protein
LAQSQEQRSECVEARVGRSMTVQDYQYAMYWRAVTESRSRLRLGNTGETAEMEWHEPQPSVWARLLARMAGARTSAQAVSTITEMLSRATADRESRR